VQNRRVADSTGNYAVEVTQSICKDTSNCYYIQISGIIENDFGDNFKIYPNPTSGKISVELGDYYDNIQIEITDIIGQIIDKKTFKNINNFELNIDGLNGIYIIVITNKYKKAVIRIIKE